MELVYKGYHFVVVWAKKFTRKEPNCEEMFLTNYLESVRKFEKILKTWEIHSKELITFQLQSSKNYRKGGKVLRYAAQVIFCQAFS